MDKVLRPERFDVIPSAEDAAKRWLHWLMTFENFMAAIRSAPDEEVNKLHVLINYVTSDVYQLFCEAETYDEAITLLKTLYIKTPNEIFARHKLATRKQQISETLDQYLQELKLPSKDCNFRQVSATQHREEAIRDAFISGILSGSIRQRLLENKTLDLQTAFDQARALDTAQKTSETYNSNYSASVAAAVLPVPEECNSEEETKERYVASTTRTAKCFFCGNGPHSRSICPAREAVCNKCKKMGHYQRVCRSSASINNGIKQSAFITLAASKYAAGDSLHSSCVDISVEGKTVSALIDSGSTHSFIHPDLVKQHLMTIQPTQENVTMATSTFSTKMVGYCLINITLKGRLYSNVKLYILPNLCTDVILGQNWQAQHESITIYYGGAAPPLKVCGLTTLNIDPPPLFQYLSTDCKPIATKSRRYSKEDKDFITAEVQQLIEKGIIEPSDSPWRAQVVVTRNERHKKRLVIDYSQTINRFTHLDAYPLPRIDDTINKIAQYKVFSTIDLKSAYHQVPIRNEEKKYTAFEANQRLYQFRRVPFGVTNGAAAFQRSMDNFISEESLEDTFAYLDNVTICGYDQVHHDRNLENFLEAAKRRNLTFNQDKCTFSTTTISILGSVVTNGEIKPDPERLSPLRDLPIPRDLKEQKRAVGLFSDYSQWIKEFAAKVRPLAQNSVFPLAGEALQSFNSLKIDVEKSVVQAVDETQPFQVETDASEFALSATLNQNGRPVAFFSRTLNGSELKHASVEKEAAAIVEAVRKWRHYLTGKHFTLITDQKSVAYMFDTKRRSKIKNDKIMRWRLELSMYDFDIIYRAGEENIPADTFSRVRAMSLTLDKLSELHQSLCHPGVTRMAHFVKSRNLPFSIDEIKRITESCKTCKECKPQYYHPSPSHLIKATQPFERLSLDFKGPLPTNNQNKFMLTIIDEYSRFPFAFPCKDVSAQSIIDCLGQLFSIFGMPAFIHSDRGSGFMSAQLKDFLLQKGISSSRTTPYNPGGNGQVERLNGTLWKTISLALKTRELPVSCWQDVLHDSLHSIRSLLCTTTNATPHERLFTHQRRSTSGTSVPTWLTTPGLVLLKRQVRKSKFDPLVDEVELLEANPKYAHVRFPDGREDTVATKFLAPQVDRKTETHKELIVNQPEVTADCNSNGDQTRTTTNVNNKQASDTISEGDKSNTAESISEPQVIQNSQSQQIQPLRRSTRARKSPDRLVYV